VYGKERKKDRKVKKNICTREWKRKRKQRKKREEEWQERYERDESSEWKK
jgi:hypothetical protein